MKPRPSSYPEDPEGFEGFLHATHELASPALVIATKDYTVRRTTPDEFGQTARRVADIIFSATDEGDLAEALGEAFGHEDFQRYCALKSCQKLNLAELRTFKILDVS
jgi:hypothetical protein